MSEEKKGCCCGAKTTQRAEEQKKKLVNRLKRLEGQIRGIQAMVEQDAYCNDILIQSAAVNAAILSKISGKSALNQQVFDNTFSVFNALKETLHEMSSELDDRLEEMGHEVKIEYRDRGKFEAQLQVADDILIFSMQSNVFEFNREHSIWQNSYGRDNKANS